MLKRTLTIIDSSGNMSEIDLNQFGKTLLYMGRDESKCDIIIADPIVSKIHGTFQLEVQKKEKCLKRKMDMSICMISQL